MERGILVSHETERTKKNDLSDIAYKTLFPVVLDSIGSSSASIHAEQREINIHATVTISFPPWKTEIKALISRADASIV